MKKHTSVRLSEHVRERLEAVASERKTNLSAIIELACERFLAHETLREDLADMEGRLGSTVIAAVREAARVGDDVQLVIGQIDLLTRFLFQTTPEIADKRNAGITGSRRYQDYLAELPKQFQGRKRRADFAVKIDERTDTAAEEDEE